MGTAVGTFSGRSNHRGRLETQLASQNIAGNYSTLNWQLYAERTSASSSYYLSNGGGESINIGGNTPGGVGAWQYDFRSTAAYLLGSGSVNVGHNPDGTMPSYGLSFSITAPGTLGSASGSSSEGLPTIPRASTPSFTPQPVDAGAVLTINTNPASGGFTHNLSYFFGSASGTIATGVGASTSWTVPLSLLNEIPNSVSGVGYIHTDTYSGATLIGSTNVSLTVQAGATVLPDFTTITNSEAVSLISSTVGAYVQGLTKLALAITGAVGAYGSTIASYQISVAGQTINASSGTTPVAIGAAGSVVITGIVTDTRGRTKTKTVTVTVLAYAPPVIDGTVFKLQRSTSLGVPDESGTYIRADLKASVSSLVVSTVQKNSLTYKIYTKVRGATTWVLQKTVALSAGVVTFNSFDEVGPSYPLTSAYDVQITVEDKFSVVPIAGTIATGNIFMHWGTGLGIGKFWEQGAVDVSGDIYAKGSRVGGFFLPQDAVTPTTPAINFPLGTSTLLVNPAAGWPFDTARYGTLVTVRGYEHTTEGGGTTQYWSDYQSSTNNDMIFFRQWFYQATAWSQWSTVNSPAGQISAFGGSTAPPGHLMCQGQSLLRASYSRLFSVISTSYGAADSTHFSVPDMRGRVPVGVDGSAAFGGLGTQGGEVNHLLSASEMPAHTHSPAVGAAFAMYTSSGGGSGLAGGSNITTTTVTGITGGGVAHNNLQPYLGVNYIIKT